jgi:hypothetical protein
MKKTTFLMLALVIGITTSAFSQFGNNRIKITEGGLNFLKGAKELNLVFTFNKMKVGDMPESDYMVKHASEVDKAKSGGGEEWKKHWLADRTERFIPTFKKYFCKRMSKISILAEENKSDAPYTLVINTDVTEPGLYTGVSVAQKTAFVDLTLTFTASNEPDKPLCVITAYHMLGDEAFDVATRINYCYSNSGNRLGSFIAGIVKKIK